MPKKKVKSDAEALSPLAGGTLVAPRATTPVILEAPAAPDVAPVAVNAAANGQLIQDAPRVDSVSTTAPAVAEPAPQDEPMHDGWLAHRPLIRASLPRIEGEQPAPRPIPEFTMHQRQGRGFGGGRGFRPFEGNGNHGQSRDGNGPNGNRPPGGGKGRHRRRRRPSGPR